MAKSSSPIVLIADPEILAIPVVENHEPLLDLKEQTQIAFGPSPEIPNNTDYTQMRRTVYEKLLQAQSFLPQGIKLALYEGLRSLTLQKQLFDGHFASLQELHPEWTPEAIFRETTKLVSPVLNQDGSQNIPPHSTGAAVDVYLIDQKGNALSMGIDINDWDATRDTELFFTACPKISEEAKKHRAIMGGALEKAGFVNYPTEYWHWSYGDRYWAYHTGHPHAFYGSVSGA